MAKQYDFSGYATRNNIQCADGRIIAKNAFKDNDGQKVPLVWNHQHNAPENTLGYALLENRDDGVYAYAFFNDTESAQMAKKIVQHGDVESLSIYANKLQSDNNKVLHGCIREVSLVLAGANPGAYIDTILMHGDDDSEGEKAVIYTDTKIGEEIKHSDEEEEYETMEDMSVSEVLDTLTDEQASAVNVLLDALDQEHQEEIENILDEVDEYEDDYEDDEYEDEGDDGMKHNVFYNDEPEDVLSHSEIVADAIADARKIGSMRESFLQHAAVNNITGLDKLFPDAHEINAMPPVIENDRRWVAKIMRDVKHSPFSRVKGTFGKMTEPQARAKGYIKGKQKTDIAMSVLNRTTTPTTVYIKNTIDRDDVVDITSFDIVAWQKREMRKNLDRELALAMLLGDGRQLSDDNKINEQNIRPVLKDDDMYTIKYTVKKGVDYNDPNNSASQNDSIAKGIIRGAIRARKQYKGSGSPTFYTTEDILTSLLLIEDQNGRLIYDSEEKLARALRVKEIVTVPEMEAEAYNKIYGIIVNMNDYTAGADKGGSINMFDDFDIDFNQMKYLMETRMSGALTVPYSAIVLNKEDLPVAVAGDPTAPVAG